MSPLLLFLILEYVCIRVTSAPRIEAETNLSHGGWWVSWRVCSRVSCHVCVCDLFYNVRYLGDFGCVCVNVGRYIRFPRSSAIGSLGERDVPWRGKTAGERPSALLPISPRWSSAGTAVHLGCSLCLATSCWSRSECAPDMAEYHKVRCIYLQGFGDTASFGLWRISRVDPAAELRMPPSRHDTCRAVASRADLGCPRHPCLRRSILFGTKIFLLPRLPRAAAWSTPFCFPSSYGDCPESFFVWHLASITRSSR